MLASEIISAALPIANFALRAIEAANAGDVAEAEEHLRQMRDLWQKGADAWDDAGE